MVATLNKLSKKQLLTYNTIVVNDKYVSDDHTAIYTKCDGGYNCLIKKSGNEALVSDTDVFDYVNQLTTEGTCTAYASPETKTIIVR